MTPKLRAPIRRKRRPRRVSERQAAKNEALIAAKVEVQERSEGRCEARFSARCTGVGVHDHHRKPRSAGGPHTATNLLRCCFNCHTEIHSYPQESYGRGLLLHSWQSPEDVPVVQDSAA